MSVSAYSLSNTVSGSSSRWLLDAGSSEAGVPRLFCFASAGGSGEVYRRWQEFFIETLHVCPVELPGRGRRMGEPFIPSLAAAAQAIAEAIQGAADGPFALFGHSMGSIIALETARALELNGLPPACLFVSSYGGPHRYREDKGLYLAPDEALVDELRRYGGTPEAVLTNAEFLQYMLPILRDDYRLLGTHITEATPLLNAPVYVCCGDAEPDVDAESLGWWQELTRESCSVTVFPGDHFYFQTDQASLLQHIAGQLRGLGHISDRSAPA